MISDLFLSSFIALAVVCGSVSGQCVFTNDQVPILRISTLAEKFFAIFFLDTWT
jgi:hypothetical protein